MIPELLTYIPGTETSQMVVRGIQDLVGNEGIRTLLSLGKIPFTWSGETTRLENKLSPEQLCAIQFFLESIYGQAGGQGIILRAGRTFFDDFLRDRGQSIGLTDLDILTLPTKKRIRAGLEVLSPAASEAFCSIVRIEEDAEQWSWRVEECPWCLRLKDKGLPHCTFDTGFLQSYLSWVTGGKIYDIRESECLNMGASACVTNIQKAPLS